MRFFMSFAFLSASAIYSAMTTLVIVESPAKAKTIEKYLGTGYQVRSSIGHVRDLPKSEKDAIDIAAGFVPNYIISPGKQKVISELRTLAKKSDKVVLAADPDREGEAIAWHVAELLKDAQPNMERVTFNEITKPAIEEAIKHPRSIAMPLKAAQEARRVLARLVGSTSRASFGKRFATDFQPVACNRLRSAFLWNANVIFVRLCRRPFTYSPRTSRVHMRAISP